MLLIWLQYRVASFAELAFCHGHVVYSGTVDTYVILSFRNAQLAKQHAPAAKLDASAKPGEKFGGTLRGSGPAKPAGKEKSSGGPSITCFVNHCAHEQNNSQHLMVLTESHDS